MKYNLFSFKIILLAICVTFSVPGHGSYDFSKGSKALFIGHSFFVPIAKQFDALAKENGFSEQQTKFVFASGHKGMPSTLWENERQKSRIKDILSNGDIELFGMPTSLGPKGDHVQAYRNWIDLALKYNPKTEFFIGLTWIPGGAKINVEKFTQKMEELEGDAIQDILELRKVYPDVKIHFVNYGIVAPIMRNMFDNGELDDITKMTAMEGRSQDVKGLGKQRQRGSFLSRIRERMDGSGLPSEEGEENSSMISGKGAKDALFVDGLSGHAGPMMSQMMALTWFHFLYEVDLEDLKYQDWNTNDVNDILSQAVNHK